MAAARTNAIRGRLTTLEPSRARKQIVISSHIPEPAVDALRRIGNVWLNPDDRVLSSNELCDAVSGADALVTLLHDHVDAAVLDAAGPQLKVVANVAVGYDNIDIAACTERGVVVTNTLRSSSSRDAPAG